MRIEEVKAALGKPVRFRSGKLHCDGIYTLTGCIIRLGYRGFRYEAEITRDGHCILVRLEDIERAEGAAPEHREITRQQANNAREMLTGCLNRMFVSDDPEEIKRMFDAVLGDAAIVRTYGLQRLEEPENE